MKSEKELFQLAKMYVMLEREVDKPLPDFELLEVLESMTEIRNTLLEKSYDVDMFVHYQQLYKNMSVAEYFEFIKTLE